MSTGQKAKFRVLAYRNTQNIGDAIQTYSVCRLLPGRKIGIFRDECDRQKGGPLFVVNGYLGEGCPTDTATLFAGIHIGRNVKAQAEWVRASKLSVGARDPQAATALIGYGVRAAVVGCATMTLQRHTGKRSGTLYIDAGHPQDIRNEIASEDWKQQWSIAEKRIEAMRAAALVVTTRLHAALPALAMGTPVFMPRDTLKIVEQPERLSILERIGFRFGMVNQINLESFARRYIEFLEANTGHSVEPVERPDLPSLR